MSERRASRWILAAILTLAAAVRLWGIGFGLPHPQCRPDEDVIAGTALRFFTGDLNPHFFNYPTLMPYLLGALYGVYFAVRLALGTGLDALIAEVTADRTMPLLIARLVSAACGVVSVALLYAIVRRWRGTAAARASALLLAVCYLHVRDSHFGTTDVPMTLGVLAALWFMVRYADTGLRRDLAWAGVCTGLAASTKYGAGLLLAPAAAAWFLAPRAGRPAGARGKDALLFASLSASAFFAASPFILLDFRAFLNHFLYEWRHVTGDPVQPVRGWLYHAGVTLPFGAGETLLAAALAGLAVCARREPRRALVLFAFPVAFYLVAGKGHAVFARYMVPVVPFLCAAAGLAIAAGAERFAARRAARGAWWAVLLLIAAGPSLSRTAAFNRLLAQRDTRLLATDWLREHAAPGTAVYQSGAWAAHVHPRPGCGEDFATWYYGRPYEPLPVKVGLMDHLPAAVAQRVAPAVPDGFDPAWEGFFAVEAGGQPRPQQDGARPDFIAIQHSPLDRFTPAPPDAVRDLLETAYQPAAAWQAGAVNAAPLYDTLDAFFVPFAGFRGVERPGPDIVLYQKRGAGGD